MPRPWELVRWNFARDWSPRSSALSAAPRSEILCVKIQEIYAVHAPWIYSRLPREAKETRLSPAGFGSGSMDSDGYIGNDRPLTFDICCLLLTSTSTSLVLLTLTCSRNATIFITPTLSIYSNSTLQCSPFSRAGRWLDCRSRKYTSLCNDGPALFFHSFSRSPELFLNTRCYWGTKKKYI